jgi:hypothetical protein
MVPVACSAWTASGPISGPACSGCPARASAGAGQGRVPRPIRAGVVWVGPARRRPRGASLRGAGVEGRGSAGSRRGCRHSWVRCRRSPSSVSVLARPGGGRVHPISCDEASRSLGRFALVDERGEPGDGPVSGASPAGSTPAGRRCGPRRAPPATPRGSSHPARGSAILQGRCALSAWLPQRPPQAR